VANPDYKRLTYGRRRRLRDFIGIPGTRAALWLGSDHILQVRSTLVSEDYRRFYFRDIQAFVIRSTRRRSYLSLTFAISLILLLTVFSLLYEGNNLAGFAIIFTVIFGLPLLVNNLLGPTCEVSIRTAVQEEALPSLCRVRRARRVLGRIGPQIHAEQGRLTTEEISERFKAMDQLPPFVSKKKTMTSPLGLSRVTPPQPLPQVPMTEQAPNETP